MNNQKYIVIYEYWYGHFPEYTIETFDTEEEYLSWMTNFKIDNYRSNIIATIKGELI